MSLDQTDTRDGNLTTLRDAVVGSPLRRRWWILAGVLGVAALLVWWVFAGADSSTDTAADTGPVSTGEVVRTDLVQTESLDGTLGRLDGDPVPAGTAGTVTAAAEPGETVEQGELLLTVDVNPVVLMYADTPAFRDLGPTEDTIAIAGRSNGTVTAVIETGTRLEQGDILYAVNGQPVVVLYGEVPAYRAMRDAATDLEGDDILQLEQALTDLGYNSGATVDGIFTDNTAAMVEDWQEDIGAAADGSVNLGEVVFIPGPAIVTDVGVVVGDGVNDGRLIANLTGTTPSEGADVQALEANLSILGFDADGAMAADGLWDDATTDAVLAWQTNVGAEADGVVDFGEVWFASGPLRITEQIAGVGSSVNPGAPVLAVSSSDTVVTVALPSEDQGTLEAGDVVTVTLPGDVAATAVVTEVATIATVSQQGSASFEVTIVLDDPSLAEGLDRAPVDVEYVTDTAFGVLAVPVTSLLVLAEGGYAVEVESGTGQTQLIAVDPGFFADGLVEVDADGLSVGDRVVIP
ncbi:MAG: HlyD family efflux transporter periplasmic adaptor subunit [Acidimicrobiia bacterium]|nr:HlyD family efflux transporter periplasmic adaptor subunit [Acidimicrobiia bacterium]